MAATASFPVPDMHVAVSSGNAPSSDVPANVKEAQEWIAAWKQRTADADAVASVQPAAEPVAEAAPAVEEAIAPGPKVYADGTVLYSAALLDSSSYEELMKVLQQKGQAPRA
ncbi:hypothetical protein GPECTOR_20g426 [Gonium pectorale]|uniref:Uncharacterized protein n=1 Tax=Gonium pectorale TaxID=33097 RepID=A0A150GID2_GONPE|nr:hypothetical protein GPECTOR_20g426 [Gonium pectorale]|eukprot:KXZ49571.1 hypothetical protein GPECTOR_20g426 [Gonium pectorale]